MLDWISEAFRVLAALGSMGEKFAGVTDPNFAGEYAAASITSASADATAVAAMSTRRMLVTFKTLEPNMTSAKAEALSEAAKWGAGERARLEAGKLKLTELQRNDPLLNLDRKMDKKFDKINHLDVKQELKRKDFVGDAEKKSKFNAEAAASIIFWAITAVEGLELLTGFGPPTDGGELEVGAGYFVAAAEVLGWAFPDDSWQGSASHAYRGRNATMQDRMTSMADVDLKLAGVVTNQASWVTHIQLGLAAEKQLLIVALLIEEALSWFYPAPQGPVMAANFAFAISALGITIAGAMIDTLCTFSFLNADKADKLATQYSGLARSLPSSSALAHTELSAGAQSTPSTFGTFSRSMSVTPGSAEVGGGWAGESAPRGAVTVGPGERRGDSATAGPAASVFTMPTLAQGPGWSEQAPRPSNRINATTGDPEQVPAMDEWDPASPNEHVGDVGDVAAAAAGAQTGSRAPIDPATVGRDQAQHLDARAHQ